MANGKVTPKNQLVACQVFRQCHGHRTLSAGKKLFFFICKVELTTITLHHFLRCRLTCMALFLLILISFPQINSFLLIKNGAVCLIV